VRNSTSTLSMTTPEDLSEALQLLADTDKKWIPFAGGTDLMVQLESNLLDGADFLNIWGLFELQGIEESDCEVVLGALTTYSEIRSSEVIKSEFPLLYQAAGLTGAKAIQNRGTIGGNIVNASPAADTPPALLCYDAELLLSSSEGQRWVDYQDFHTGYKTHALAPGELITHIKLRRGQEKKFNFYHKVGTRNAQAISKVLFCLMVQVNNSRIEKFRLALGSMAATPILMDSLRDAFEEQEFGSDLIEKGLSILNEELSPIDDIRSTGAYRKKVTLNLFKYYMEKIYVGLGQ